MLLVPQEPQVPLTRVNDLQLRLVDRRAEDKELGLLALELRLNLVSGTLGFLPCRSGQNVP